MAASSCAVVYQNRHALWMIATPESPAKEREGMRQSPQSGCGAGDPLHTSHDVALEYKIVFLRPGREHGTIVRIAGR
jgi:hypothetical protein